MAGFNLSCVVLWMLCLLGSALLCAPGIAVTAQCKILLVSIALLLLSIDDAMAVLGGLRANMLYMTDIVTTVCMLQASGSPSVSLTSQAVQPQAEVSSHAIEGVVSHAVEDPQGPLPSHALEDEEVPSFALQGELGSPQSSVGSARMVFGSPDVPRRALKMHLDMAKVNAAVPRALSTSPSSPFEAAAQTVHSDFYATPASGFESARTPLSSHAVADSTDSDSLPNTARSNLNSHAVNHSSSSGSGTDEGFTPTSLQQDAVFL